MSLSWIWSDKITNERVARVGYNHFISNKGEWNNCFSKFSNRVLPPIFTSTILQSVRKENLAHYFSYDVKLGLLAHSRSFLANQKARNAIVGAENLLIRYIHRSFVQPRSQGLSSYCPWSEPGETLAHAGHVTLWQLKTSGRGPLRWASTKIKVFCENNAHFDSILAYIVMQGPDI